MAGALDGKVAWVTGGSGGIGSGIVRSLHDAGATVVSADVSEAQPVKGERIIYRRCDVTQQDDIDALARFCRDELGGLDILCNNAGVIRRMGILDMTREVWERILSVNLTAYFFCAQAAARLMIEGKRPGAIVNISSVAAEHVHLDGLGVPYCTSKGGVKTLTLALAAGLGKDGIRVNAVAPGSIVTEMEEGHWTPEYLAMRESQTPLGRVGRPADIGPAVVYLASDQASFVSGMTMYVHGGRTIAS